METAIKKNETVRFLQLVCIFADFLPRMLLDLLTHHISLSRAFQRKFTKKKAWDGGQEDRLWLASVMKKNPRIQDISCAAVRKQPSTEWNVTTLSAALSVVMEPTDVPCKANITQACSKAGRPIAYFAVEVSERSNCKTWEGFNINVTGASPDEVVECTVTVAPSNTQVIAVGRERAKDHELPKKMKRSMRTESRLAHLPMPGVGAIVKVRQSREALYNRCKMEVSDDEFMQGVATVQCLIEQALRPYLPKVVCDGYLAELDRTACTCLLKIEDGKCKCPISDANETDKLLVTVDNFRGSLSNDRAVEELLKKALNEVEQVMECVEGVCELCQETEKVAEEAMGKMKLLKAELAASISRLRCLEGTVCDLQHECDSHKTAIQDLQSAQDSLCQRMNRLETHSRDPFASVIITNNEIKEGSSINVSIRAPKQDSKELPCQLQSIRDKLSGYYSRGGCVQDNPLLASSTMQHVRLNLVQPEQRRPVAGRINEAVTVRLARGGPEQVPNIRIPIEYENILTLSPPPGITRKRVLIEGVPGSGKSTLVQRMCHDWSIGQFAKDFELVIQVNLRRLPKDQELSLQDLIYTSVADDTVSKEIVRFISSSNGARVLFIFDGYDEISEEVMQTSIICDILEGRFAPLSSFVVTTRPVSAEDLYHCVDRRVEICGFGDEEVKDYITKYFASSNPLAGEKLLSTLATRPIIKRLCYVPLLLLMVCFIAAQGGDTPNIPCTMHQLYENIIILTVNYNLKRAGKKQRAGSLRDVIRLCPSFDKLIHLAFEGIEGNTIIFSKINFEVDEALHGLVNCIEAQNRYGTITRTWHFLHLTLQEFMAGLTVAERSPEEQVTFWRNHLNPRYDKYGRFVLAEDHYKTVFLFYCGQNGLSNPDIQKMLLDTLGTEVEPIISEYTPLAELCEAVSESGNEEFAYSILSVCGTTVNVRNLYIQGVGWVIAQYCQRVEGVKLILNGIVQSPFAQFASIASQLEPVCSLSAIHLLHVFIKVLPSPADLENVKNFLLKQQHLKSFRLTIAGIMVSCKEALELLTSLCNAAFLRHQMSLEEVVVDGKGVGLNLFTKYSLDPLVPALLTCLKLTVLKLRSATLSHVNTLAMLETLQNLQEFALRHVPITESQSVKQQHSQNEDYSTFGVSLERQLQLHPNLKMLVVNDNYSGSLLKGAVAGMSKRDNVEKLTVKCSGDHPRVPRESVLQIVRMINRGCLKVLKIGQLTPSRCLKLLEELPHCTYLRKLRIEMAPTHIQMLKASSCTAVLLKAVLQCACLEELALENFSFDGIDDAIKYFAKNLENTGVTSLKMIGCYKLTPSQIATLCEGLHRTRSLVEFCIEYYLSEDEDVSDPDRLQSVETAVRENGSLRKIAIHTIPSYDSRLALHTRIKVAVAILKGAAKNKTLRTLNLSIPDEPVPAPELVDEVRRLNSKLQLTIEAGKNIMGLPQLL